MKNINKLYSIPYLHITDHSVEKFIDRNNHNIKYKSKYDYVNFLKNRLKDILYNKIEFVEVIEIVDRTKKSLNKRKDRTSKNISLLDIELSLIYIVSVDDCALVTVRNDTCNYKKRRDKIFGLYGQMKGVSWIPVISNDEDMSMFYSLYKKIPNPKICFIIGEEEYYKKNKCYSMLVNNLKNIIFFNNIDQLLNYDICDKTLVCLSHIPIGNHISNIKMNFNMNKMEDHYEMNFNIVDENENIIEKMYKKYTTLINSDALLESNIKAYKINKWAKFIKKYYYNNNKGDANEQE